MFESRVPKEIPILTVSELTEAIKLQLENQFRFICLQGEVSNCKMQSSGHIYFTLKDENAQISAVMFRLDAAALPRPMKDGDQIVAKGALGVYPPSGKYQIVVRELKFAGIGELLLKLEELKIKLQKKGYFKPEHKKPLPKFPRRIGIVTSPTGAAIQDILNVLGRRFKGIHLILNPVKVQGEGAAQEIAKAIDAFNFYQLADVIIVGRGGGSIEDLWAFNEEIVAESIFRSKIPIISAVGHETDHSIADYVADVRAPTPSAAAEIVIAEKTVQLKNLLQLEKNIKQHLIHLLRLHRDKLSSILKRPDMQSPYALLGQRMQKMDDIKAAIDRHMLELIRRLKLKIEGLTKQNEALKPTKQITILQQKFHFFDRDLRKTWRTIIEGKRNHLRQISHLLNTIDPKNLLSKGYSIIFSENNGSIINSIRAVEKGQNVKIMFSDGNALSTINETIPK